MEKKNVIDIHNHIVQYFEDQTKYLPLYKQKINDLHRIKQSASFTSDETTQHELDAVVRDLQQEYDEIKTRQRLHFYLIDTTEIIEAYKHELSKPLQLNFLGPSVPSAEETALINHLHKKYIKIAQKYYPLKNIQLASKHTCDGCASVTEEVNVFTASAVCTGCGIEKNILQSIFSYKDTDRINITAKYTYDRRVHFKECINQFQGKQNSTIPLEVYEYIISQLELHGLVRPGNLPAKIKYEKVTKYHVCLFLKELDTHALSMRGVKCSSHYYEDVNLIYHNITGNELDNISHLEDVLMDDFDQLSSLYNDEYIKNKKITRKNFINTHYVLFQLLRRHKYPCSRADFNFLKTVERKNFHDDICSALFKKLGWNFTNVF
jgi:hypothetical protein